MTVNTRFFLKLLCCVLLFCLIGFYFFPRNTPFLYTGLDGHYLLLMARHQLTLNNFIFGITNNFLQGRGDIWMPVNAYFDFSVLPFILFNAGEVSPVIAYVILTCGYFVSLVFVLRSMQFSHSVVLTAAALTVALSIPFVGFGPLYYLFSLSPLHCVSVTYANFFVYFMRAALMESGIKAWVFSLVATLFMTFNVIAFPAAVTFWILYSVILIGPALIKRARADRPLQEMAALVLPLTAVVPLAIYLQGLLIYTGAYIFEGVYQAINIYDVSILFEPVPALIFPSGLRKPFFILALSSVVLCLLLEPKSRKLDTSFVLLGITIVVLGGYLGHRFAILARPRPLYIEIHFWPFYVAYILRAANILYGLASTLAVRIFSVLRPPPQRLFHVRHVADRIASAADRFGFLAGPAAIAVYFAMMNLPARLPRENLYPYPPNITPIVGFLKEQITLVPGRPFNGRVQTRFVTKPRQVIEQDHLRLARNDYRTVGLWYYDIPTVAQYTFLTSPLLHVHGTSLRNSDDASNPMYQIMAASFGVKYLISDVPLADNMLGIRRLVMKEELGEAHVVFLYELDNPTLGVFTPHRPVSFRSVHELWQAFESRSFDPTSDYWNMDFEESENPVPASKASLAVSKGGLRISAESVGTSVVIIPLEFSHCLQLHADTEDSSRKLFMANMGATGLRFSRRLEAEISYRNGPFENPLCRFRDYENFMQKRDIFSSEWKFRR